MKTPPLILFIVGPTASGKTKIAIQLAKRLHGEIISADSMMVYKGMDIGTAKPTLRERQKIVHHLMDCFSPGKSFSVADFYDRAVKVIHSLARRRVIPIVVGGTGLYLRSLLQGLADLPGCDLKFRRLLEKEAAEKGLPVLYERLQRLDREKAKWIKPGDQKRIIRALEILHENKIKPHLKVTKRPALSDLGYQTVVIGLNKDRKILYADIEKRVDAMFRRGLVCEVKHLRSKKISMTARQAVGYKEIFSALEGKISIAEARALVKRNTRRLAKRQMTWFRKEPGIRWFWSDQCASREIIESVMDELTGKLSVTSSL